MNKNKLKITYIITKSEIGGAQSHLLEIASSLINKGHEICVITGDEGWLTDKLSQKKISWEILPGLKNTYNPIALISFLLRLRKWIKINSPDIVHGHSSIAGLVSRLATKGTSTKSVFTMHGCPYSKAYPWYHRALSWLFEWFINQISDTTVIYVSLYDRNLSEQMGVCARNNLVIYNGIEELEERNGDDSEREIKILMTSLFQFPKDHFTVIKTAEILKNDPFVFYFIGDGPLKEKTEIVAKELNLKNIQFLGSVKDAKYRAKDFDIFLLSSMSEGLPISIIEAMSSSLPIIATNVGGIRELIVNGENGFVIEPGNPEKMASAILNLKSLEKIALMGAKSNEIFRVKFSKQKMVHELEKVYQRI